MSEPTTVTVELGGRQIKMRKMSDAAFLVLARVSRGMPTRMIENGAEMPPEVRDRLVRDLGTLGKIVDGMIVDDDDKDWLEDAMITGEVSAEAVIGSIGEAARKFNGQTAPAKKAAPVRRVRR